MGQKSSWQWGTPYRIRSLGSVGYDVRYFDFIPCLIVYGPVQWPHLFEKSYPLHLHSNQELVTLINDIVKSSAIEGENLNPDEVRSSIARRLGIDTAGLIPAGRDVEGVVEMMLCSR